MRNYLLTSIVVLAVLAVACSRGSEPPPAAQLPDEAVGVNDLYAFLQSEMDANEPRLRQREDQNQSFFFRGSIGSIEDKALRFDIVPPTRFDQDQYVVCNFSDNNDVVRVSKGDDVGLTGELARVFRGRYMGYGDKHSAIFDNCSVVEVYAVAGP